MKVDNIKAQMRKGVLELCILSIIRKQEVYPSDIIDKLSKSDLIVVEGTLYPMLTRLKNAGLLEYNWKESQFGPPRKYFTITEAGEEVWHVLKKHWDDLIQSVQLTMVTE